MADRKAIIFETILLFLDDEYAGMLYGVDESLNEDPDMLIKKDLPAGSKRKSYELSCPRITNIRIRKYSMSFDVEYLNPYSDDVEVSNTYVLKLEEVKK